MSRKCTPKDQEGTKREAIRPKEVSEQDKWHKICTAIQTAGNLVVEIGSCRVSTNHIIPLDKPKLDVGPCLLYTSDAADE